MKAEDMSHQECELFLECILDITRMMLEAGNEAQRVERIALRIMGRPMALRFAVPTP